MKFLDNKSYIMGILNITPDSFSDGGVYFNNVMIAIDRAKRMVEEGASIIDVGGESSRPGSDLVSEEEELRRVLPIIRGLRKEISVPISIDTRKANVARMCIEEGAKIINDITGLSDPAMINVALNKKVPVVIMHMQGEPKTMQTNPFYKDVVQEICDFFANRVKIAKAAGLDQLILDPGIGFGKKLEHNLTIINHLSEFKKLGYPVLVGPSRKSFIGQIIGLPLEQRLYGTIAAVVACRLNGANIFRVHDVKACKEGLQIADAILNYKSS